MLTTRVELLDRRSGSRTMQSVQILFKRDDAIRATKHGFENVEQISCALVGNDLQVLATGMALKSSRDLSADEVGLKLAFTRALHKFTPDKGIRAQLWKAFQTAIQAQEVSNLAEELAQVQEPLSIPQEEESEEIRNQAALVASLEADHNENVRPTEECSQCNEARERLRQLRSDAA